MSYLLHLFVSFTFICELDLTTVSLITESIVSSVLSTRSCLQCVQIEKGKDCFVENVWTNMVLLSIR